MAQRPEQQAQDPRRAVAPSRSTARRSRPISRTSASGIEEVGFGDRGGIDIGRPRREARHGDERRARPVAQLLRRCRGPRDDRRPRPRPPGALHRRGRRSGFARHPRSAGQVRRGHRLRRSPVVRPRPEFRRPAPRLHGLQEGTPPPAPRPDRRPDQGRGRPARIRPDPVHARAAHPPRKGDLEHLHEPGLVRPAGDDLPGDAGPRRPARDGRSEHPESRLCRSKPRPDQGCQDRASAAGSSTSSSWTLPKDAPTVNAALKAKGILGGLALGRILSRARRTRPLLRDRGAHQRRNRQAGRRSSRRCSDDPRTVDLRNQRQGQEGVRASEARRPGEEGHPRRTCRSGPRSPAFPRSPRSKSSAISPGSPSRTTASTSASIPSAPAR